MELPADDEMVDVSERLEMSTAALLNCEPDHTVQSKGPSPSGSTWPREKVGFGEQDVKLSGVSFRFDGHTSKVEHVGDCEDGADESEGPFCEVVQLDAPIERDKVDDGSVAG